MKLAFLTVSLLTVATAPALAASCSSWKALCEKRGGSDYCQAQFNRCLQTGTWTEGDKFGGATHTGVTKK